MMNHFIVNITSLEGCVVYGRVDYRFVARQPVIEITSDAVQAVVAPGAVKYFEVNMFAYFLDIYTKYGKNKCLSLKLEVTIV